MAGPEEGAVILTDEQPAIDLQKLFAEAVADVELGRRHPCNSSPTCRAALGCPRCLHAALKGIDVARIDVFVGVGIVRLTMEEGCGKTQPCVVAFQVPLTIHN
jgi:hypothetical protein